MAQVSLETLGRNAWVGAMAEVWRIGSRFLLTPIVLHAIGLRGYGTWSLVFSLTTYMSMTNASLGIAYNKFTAECVRTGAYDRLARIIGAGIATVSAASCVGLVAIWWMAPVILQMLHVPVELRGDARVALAVVMSVLVARMTIGCTLDVLAGLQRIDRAQQLNVLASVIDFAISVPLLLQGLGLRGIATGYAVGQVSAYLLAWFFVRRLDPRIVISPFSATLEGLREIVRVGGRFQLLAVVNTTVAEGIRFLLSVLVDPSATALYDLADKLVNLGRALSGAVLAPLLAAFADLQAGVDVAAERNLFVHASKAVAIVSAATFAYLSMFASSALLAWTGTPVLLAAHALQVLAPFEIVTQQTGVVSANLRARGMVRMELTYALIGAATLVVVLLIGARTEPFESVVWGRVISEVVGVAWYLRAFFRYSGMRPRNWWNDGRFSAVLVSVGLTAVGVEVCRRIVPALPLHLTPRWHGVVDVCLWSVPYALLVVTSTWKIALDASERVRLRVAMGRWLSRSAA